MNKDKVSPDVSWEGDCGEPPQHSLHKPLPAPLFLLCRHSVWKATQRWFVDNTYALPWLPTFLQPWYVGYLASFLLQLLAFSFTMLLWRMYPGFDFVLAPAIFVVLLISFGWGAAPGLMATLSGAVFLIFATFPPYATLNVRLPMDIISIIFYLGIGLTVSLIASQVQRARSQAEAALKQVEYEKEALRQSEQEAVVHANQLEATIEAIADAVAVFGPHGELLSINSTGRAVLDINADLSSLPRTLALRGESMTLCDWEGNPLPCAQWPQMRVLRGEILTGNSALDIVLRSQGGVERYLSVSGAPVRDVLGKVVGAVCVARNVTERRQLEQRLRDAERAAAERANQLEAVFEAITDGVFILDAHGATPRMNRAARALIELPDGAEIDPRGPLPFELLDEQGHPLPRSEWPEMRLLKGEQLQGADAVDVWLRTRSQQIHALGVTGAPLYDSDGELRGAVLVCRDVTERRHLEQRTQQALRALLVLAEELVQLPTSSGKLVDETNRSSSMESVAHLLAELIRQVVDCKRVSITTIDEATQKLHSLAVVGLSSEDEQLWRDRNTDANLSNWLAGDNLGQQFSLGNVVVMDMRQQALLDHPNPYGISTLLLAPMRLGSRLVGVLALDQGGEERKYTEGEKALAKAIAELAALVLERERLLEERAEDQAYMLALNEASRLKDEFISIASHELRTPLTTIKASVQLAQRQLSRVLTQRDIPVDEIITAIKTVQHLLDRAERQVGMQNRLVNDLLDVSRIEAGRLELNPALHDLCPLVSEVVEDQQALMPGREIVFENEVAGEILVMVDADRLRQVVSNYLSNALKYSEADNPVTVCIELLKSQVRVAVRDQGPGLTSTEQQRIWDRFYRVPGVEVKSGSGVGLGLGLHISRMIIERQGGKVGVQSRPGRGSTFWFTLPRAE